MTKPLSIKARQQELWHKELAIIRSAYTALRGLGLPELPDCENDIDGMSADEMAFRIWHWLSFPTDRRLTQGPWRPEYVRDHMNEYTEKLRRAAQALDGVI